MKKKKNIVYRKSVSLLAAAAMTAVLMTGQIYPAIAWGQNIENRLEESSLIPENITIDEPVALSEVELPKSDYGTLSWEDDSYVPDKRVQSCQVVFKPAADVDLSYLSGWDAEKKVVKGKITLVVSSLEDDNKGNQESGTENNENSDSEDSAAIPVDNVTPSVSPEEIKTEEDTTGEEKTTGEEAPAGEEDEKNDPGTDEDNGLSGDILEEYIADPAAEEEKKEENGSDVVSDKKEDTSDNKTADNKIVDNNVSGETDVNTPQPAEETFADTQTTEDTGKLNEFFGAAMPGATVLDGEDASEKKNSTESDSTEIDSTESDQKNIFDNPLDFSAEDTRSSVAEENLTEEEQEARAAENHNCDGISVSGIDLPWYVQFQVTSGDDHEFKNEDKATIFQSYEFRLWDLKNNTEYEIPDGQYVSVTIPVKEGYEYSIEHLLDNGATETIVPSVNGSTMIFSTHSFSPFGIAGFRPLVGEDIANGAYDDKNTPTPTPTVTISGTPTPSPAVTGAAADGNVSTPGTTGGANGTTGDANGTTGSTNGTAGGINGTTSGTGTVGTEGSSGTGTGTGTGTESGTSTGADTNGTSTALAGTASNESAGQSQNINNSQGQMADSSQNQTSNAVKTGDNTVILPFVILVLAAAAVIIIVLIVRKKKEK